ncbi:MAG: hypothetical protein AB7G68_12570 [Nitrospiraceae bacterium]
MTDTKYHTTESGSLEGRVFRPATDAELSEAVELAFDYRGDVTLELSSGETLLGYLFNRSVTEHGPAIEVIPATGEPARTIPYADVRSIAFSGEDTANGKSWETWVAKKETERHAEADHIAAQAKARGHL